eukprot:NODE_797_length_2759_cov_5.878419.p1 GENE.NODE_797_length_2759_cov_5.878419~~NODE_797_length_2759_cov_5.878419.p1  ORF type:complete len:864 (-),score=180.59 NODE_797_length_2759_cov_5.878419:166-2532(-)
MGYVFGSLVVICTLAPNVPVYRDIVQLRVLKRAYWPLWLEDGDEVVSESTGDPGTLTDRVLQKIVTSLDDCTRPPKLTFVLLDDLPQSCVSVVFMLFTGFNGFLLVSLVGSLANVALVYFGRPFILCMMLKLGQHWDGGKLQPTCVRDALTCHGVCTVQERLRAASKLLPFQHLRGAICQTIAGMREQSVITDVEGCAELVDQLKHLVDDTRDGQAAARAVEAFGESKSDITVIIEVNNLLNVFRHSEKTYIRSAGLKELGSKGLPALHGLLSLVEEEKDADNHKDIVQMLGGIAIHLKGLLALLDEDNGQEVRATIVRAMRRMGKQPTPSGLKAILDSEEDPEKNHDIRKCIVRELGNFGEPAADHLLTILDRPFNDAAYDEMVLACESLVKTKKFFGPLQENAAGSATAAVVPRAPGGVLTWGAGSSGGDSSAIRAQLRSGVQALFSTATAFAALKDDGSVVTWGDCNTGGDSGAVQHQLRSGVQKIIVFTDAFAAVKDDGSYVGWGHRGHEKADEERVALMDSATRLALMHTPVTDANRYKVTVACKALVKENKFPGVLKTLASPCEGQAFAAVVPGFPGAVVTWGDGGSVGKLSADSTAVGPLLNGGVVAVCSTHDAFAALKDDGSVVAWGSPLVGGNIQGAIGGTTSSGVRAVAAHDGGFAALKDDGSVVCWGHGVETTAVQDQLTGGVREVYGSSYAFAALKDDGSVVAWGDRHCGGDSSGVKDQLTGGVQKIIVSTHAFVAVKDDGSYVGWGYRGQEEADEEKAATLKNAGKAATAPSGGM